MFLQYYGHVARPLSEIEQRLPELGSEIAGWGEGTYRDGEALRLKVGTDQNGGLVAKSVSLTLGPPDRGHDTIRMPLAWEATGTPGLFPRMSADLVLASLGGELTQVKLEGSYEPPLGAVGRMLDRAILHRVAETSVKALVDRIIEALGGTPEPSEDS